MASSEEEIYSIMFTSLKHPVRRKILRMLADKPMTFMEIVENLGVSTSNLTYHLESLGELISKMDNGQYKLSSFGLATVSAMKGVEEAPPQIEPKRLLKLSFRWKAVLGVLMIAVLVLSGMAAIQYVSVNQLSTSQQSLSAENKQLLSWGLGADKVSAFLQNVPQLSIGNYTIRMDSDTMQYRTDFNVAEDVAKYSLTSAESNLDVNLRFRNNHFSRYELNMIESSPIFSQIQPTDVLQNAKNILGRYQAYSGDAYLQDMLDLLNKVNQTENTIVAHENMKLQISVSGGTVVFTWMYTEGGIDYQTKGLQMTFQNNVLTTMTDGYSLFTIGSTALYVSQDQAVKLAENYVKNTLTWKFDGKDVSGFSVVDPPVSIQLVPHTRGNSVALYPYWYIEMRLNQVYSGGINEVTVGIYGDTGQVADVQMLSVTT